MSIRQITIKNKNEKLKNSLEVRKPDLNLQINGTTNFKIPFFEENSEIVTQIINVIIE